VLFCLGHRRLDLEPFRICFVLLRTIDVESWCTGRLQHEAGRKRKCPLLLSRCLVLAAGTWTISGRGSCDPAPDGPTTRQPGAALDGTGARVLRLSLRAAAWPPSGRPTGLPTPCPTLARRSSLLDPGRPPVEPARVTLPAAFGSQPSTSNGRRGRDRCCISNGVAPQPDEPCRGRLPVLGQAHVGTRGQSADRRHSLRLDMLTMTRSACVQVRCAVVALWSEHHPRYARQI
jgi:hypothetical protein